MTHETLDDIRREFERVSPDVVAKASGFAASILADVAGRRGTLDGRIAPLVAHFSEKGKLSKKDIAELKRLIEELDHDR